MIIINFKGIEASLENEKWTCKDKQLKILLDLYTYDLLEGYSSGEGAWSKNNKDYKPTEVRKGKGLLKERNNRVTRLR